MNETEEAGRHSNTNSRLEHDTRQREFIALLMPVLPRLTRFCRALCRGTHGIDAERAKDLLSETILKAYEHFDRVREPAALLSYLFTIASRASRYERKKSARSQPFSDIDLEQFVDERNAPDANADVANLYAALEKLPAKQREAIVMSEITGLKLEEVAQIQGASISAVKSRVSRGRKKLAKLLGVREETRSVTAVAPTQPESGQSFYRFAFSAKEKL